MIHEKMFESSKLFYGYTSHPNLQARLAYERVDRVISAGDWG
jgi:hypothetical protein